MHVCIDTDSTRIYADLMKIIIIIIESLRFKAGCILKKCASLEKGLGVKYKAGCSKQFAIATRALVV